MKQPRLTTNRGYVESNLQSGSSSVVEHRLAKARVASSNLVSRSNIKDEGGRMKDESWAFIANLGFILPPSSVILASGGVAKW
jgi:hypothetical protein